MRTSAKKGVTERSKNKSVLSLAVILLMCALFLVGLFFFIRSFLPVKDFELMGMTQYEKNELAGISGIQPGDKLYSVDLDAAKERILESCPYVDEITIKRKFPNTVVFDVSDKTAHWYVELSGDYYALDGELYVIEETVSNEKFVNAGVPRLALPNLKRLMCGELPQFGESENEVKKALELIAAVQSTAFKSRLTLVDMESRFDVNIVVDGKYKVYMGDISNTEEKLRAVESILDTERVKEYTGAEIDASVPETISVKPIYSYD